MVSPAEVRRIVMMDERSKRVVNDPELGSCLFCPSGGRPVFTEDAAGLYTHVTYEREETPDGQVSFEEDLNWASHRGLAIVCLDCTAMLPSLDTHLSLEREKEELAHKWNRHRTAVNHDIPEDYDAPTDEQEETELKQGGLAQALFDD